jgi:hypothetical protein
VLLIPADHRVSEGTHVLSITPTWQQVTLDPDSLPDYQRRVFDLLASINPDTARDYALCGRRGLGYVEYCGECLTQDGVISAHYHPFSCHLRICPKCAKRQAKRVQEHYRPAIEHVFEHMRRGWSVKHITLTRSIDVSDKSADWVKVILDQTMELYERLFGKEKGAGVITTLEVGENGTLFHTHSIVYGPFVRQHTISKTWRDITGGDFIVWARRFESADAAIGEGLKYITKFTHIAPEKLYDLHYALLGRRRIRSRGCFYASKNNPLRDILDADSDWVCECPNCGRAMDILPEQVFVSWAYDLLHHLPPGTSLIPLDDPRYSDTLNLTCGNKFSEEPP